MALMKQRKLHLSLIRQRDISDCGPACLASVCGFYGLQVTVSAIRHLALTDQKGTSVLGIVEAAIVLGLDAKGIRTEYGSLGLMTLPAIAHVIIDEKISHYMVLVKATAKGVLVMDPAEGKLKKLTEEEFRKIWTGVMIMMLPGDKFLPNEKISDFTRIKELVSPFKKLLILASVCAAIVSFLGISMSVYVKEIVDEILVKKDKLLLEIISAMAIILLLIQFLVSITRNLLVLKTGRSINSSLIMAYYRHVLKLPQSFFNRMQVGEILSRINDAVKITTFIHDVAVNIIVDILVVIFSLAMMFYYNWRIALLILSIVPFYGLLYHISNRINKNWQRRIAVAGAELDASLVESLGIVATIKQLAIEKFFSDKIAIKLDRLLNNVYASSVKQLYIQHTADALSKIFTILLLWVGSYYVIGNTLTTGELISFYTLLTWFSVPVLYLLGANKSFTDAKIAAERLFEIMGLQQAENGWKKIHVNQDLRIEFKNVEFSYGYNEPLLKGINLSITGGTITGIRGKSGSGKSTLASLLLRMYTPVAGIITVNGIDINEIKRENLAEIITMVSQETGLFSATIKENIMIGREYDKRKLEDICERLGIFSFASLFPGGMDTVIAEQGNNLSGGQKQRISIARALFRNSPVLILDEATSAIDKVSEEKIMQTIEWYKNNGNTVIIIAHSDSTLKICDNIVVLEDGVIK